MNLEGKKSNLERCYRHMTGVGEQLLLSTLLVVTFAWVERPNTGSALSHSKQTEPRRTLELHPNPVRYTLDTTRPEFLVEFGVDPDVGGAHGFCSEFDNGLDGMGSPLLERPSVDTFVEVDGVLPRHDILESGASLASLHRSPSASQNRYNSTAVSTFLVLFGGAYKGSFSRRSAATGCGNGIPFLRYQRIDGSSAVDGGVCG